MLLDLWMKLFLEAGIRPPALCVGLGSDQELSLSLTVDLELCREFSLGEYRLASQGLAWYKKLDLQQFQKQSLGLRVLAADVVPRGWCSQMGLAEGWRLRPGVKFLDQLQLTVGVHSDESSCRP
jgi:hypothetical protein